MTIEEFESLYQKQKPQLDKSLASLRKLLSEGIKMVERALNQQDGLGDLRIRFDEFRVKDCESLYRKIENDITLRFEHAFRPSHVRDLLGARLVVPNLSDVQYVIDTLEKGRWGELNYVKPEKGHKNYLEKANEKSGYRGVHVDLRWKRKDGKRVVECFAELQVRTMLQDAWATFMHDDLYKGHTELVLPDALLEQCKDLSEILFVLDKSAQRIRESIANTRLGEMSSLKAAESLSQAMFSTLAYLKVAHMNPDYKELERHDFYIVDSEDAVFNFEVSGECRRPQVFCFPLAGDTPADHVSNIAIRSFDQGLKRWTDVEFKQADSTNYNASNAIVLLAGAKSKNHRFQIRCNWKGVFARGREYVWCPWASTYRGAIRKYSLSLSFRDKPKIVPKLMRAGEYGSIRAMIEAAENGKGELGMESNDHGRTIFKFEPSKDVNDDFFCLFRQ